MGKSQNLGTFVRGNVSYTQVLSYFLAIWYSLILVLVSSYIAVAETIYIVLYAGYFPSCLLIASWAEGSWHGTCKT